MGALFDFKCTCDSTSVYICQADAEKCIFVWTILSQTPRRTPQVTSDAGRISARIFWLFPKERRMLRKRDYQGRLSFHFFDRWMTDLATHRQKKVQAMSWKNLQMLEFCHFTWSWMGPINCAPNPHPHLTQDTNGRVTNSQLDITNQEPRGPSSDHKASINRGAQTHNKYKIEMT